MYKEINELFPPGLPFLQLFYFWHNSKFQCQNPTGSEFSPYLFFPSWIIHKPYYYYACIWNRVSNPTLLL